MKKKLFVTLFALSLTHVVSAKSKATLPLDEIRNFVDVYNTIKQEYVEEKDGQTLIDYAIKGMLQGLDPHSEYFKKDGASDYNEAANGQYSGFGVQLSMENGRLIIISPIADSPADKAGLEPNDVIAQIDGVVIEDLSMNEASKLLKDKESVVLTIARRGQEPFEVTLKRSKVTLPSVTSQVLDKQYGYIRIKQFQDSTEKQFNKALKQLLEQSVKGLVLDLRNNPGGLLHVATGIADNFLDAGLIVSMKNQNTGDEEKIHAKKSTLAKELPLVVLINAGSASASELLAGALQNHQRAIIVGRPSFGKGSVQNMITLSNGDAIKLTTARYYTPDGISIQAEGITPDIILSQLKVDDKKVNLLSYSESDIAGHLKQSKKKQKQNKQDKKATDKPATAEEKTDSKESGDALAKKDLQLFEALNVLKVLNLRK